MTTPYQLLQNAISGKIMGPLKLWLHACSWSMHRLIIIMCILERLRDFSLAPAVLLERSLLAYYRLSHYRGTYMENLQLVAFGVPSSPPSGRG